MDNMIKSVSLDFALLLLVFMCLITSGCYLGFERRMGDRTLPNPQNNSFAKVSSQVPTLEGISTPPISICLPTLESGDPRGLSLKDGDYKGVFSVDPKSAILVIHGMLAIALEKSGVRVQELKHECEYSFLRNGNSDYYLRTEILFYEVNSDTNGEMSAAFGLNLSLYRQGGYLLYTGRHAGASKSTRARKDVTWNAMIRLVNGLGRGKFQRVF